MLVAVDDQAVGALAVADAIKDSAHEAVSRLRAMGLRCVLLSGDSEVVTAAVGQQLGVDDVGRRGPSHREGDVRPVPAIARTGRWHGR